jgi:hypothetical protein
MASADRDQDGFEVPSPVAAELRAGGYVRAESSSEAAARKATFLVLTVRHRGVSSVVFLVQVPGVIRALAQALVIWFSGSALDDRLELVARQAGGDGGRFRSESDPGVDGVADFLRDGIWGGDAPPDESPPSERAGVRPNPLTQIHPVRLQRRPADIDTPGKRTHGVCGL